MRRQPRWVSAWRGVWIACLAGVSAWAQVGLLIDPATLAWRGTRLEFQFEAPAGDASEFSILRAAVSGSEAAWLPVAGAQVEPVVEGRFRASLPVEGGGIGFVRVRWSGLPPVGPSPVFNEVMSDNVAVHEVGVGRFPDWIELYNPHDEAIALTGYTLSDDPLGIPGWTFPEVRIPALGHLLVYAAGDGAGVGSGVGPLWATFGIRSGGEVLVMADPFGREVDRLILPPLGPDQSVGRSPDGAAGWLVFSREQVTPGGENREAGVGVSVVAPELTLESGYVEGPTTIRLTTRQVGGRVRYTTDGSVPTLESSDGALGLEVSRTMVVRAVIFDPEGRRSEETVRTYLVGVRHALPVVSMAAPASHFEFRNGYLIGMGSRVLDARGAVLQNYPFSGSNAWQDREVEVAWEWLEPDGRVGARQRAGLKVYGGWGSRGYPQKSFALFARKRYGAGRFEHEFFPDQDVDRFESLVLRNSGNDNQSTHQIPPRPPIVEYGPTKSYGSYFVNGTFTLLRDGLMQRLLGGFTGLDTQAYRPVVLYLNGGYWGIYNLREKLSEHHLREHYGLPEGSIDLIEGYGEVRAGDSQAYRAMRDYVAARSMAVEANFQHVVSTFLDEGNFIDYNLAVLYFQNFDIGNVKCWRPRTPRGRFHWMVYDQDYGFGLWPSEVYEPAMRRDYADYGNMLRFATAGTGTSTGWPNAGGRTLLLRRLLANPGFRERFILRGADLLNSAFREERVERLAGEMAAGIRAEIPAHLRRWSWEELRRLGYGAPYQPEFQPFTQSTWETNLQVLTEFARKRPTEVRRDFQDYFGMRGGVGELRVAVEPEGAGRVRVNSLLPETFPWQGTYFVDFTNRLMAVPNPGYRFAGWRASDAESSEPTLGWVAEVGEVRTVTARFERAIPGATPRARLWISEIQYHAPEDLDSDDWIEIHNPTDQAVDLAGWVVRDGADEVATILPAVELKAGGYAVVARRVAKFQWAYPEAGDPVAELGFGLGNGGDRVRLWDPEGNLAVEVAYGDRDPWPGAADGGGSTLQLLHPDRSPGSPEAWGASVKRGGTPGQP